MSDINTPMGVIVCPQCSLPKLAGVYGYAGPQCQCWHPTPQPTLDVAGKLLQQSEGMMGREVRRVPANWQHPIDPDTGRYKPLFDGAGFADALREWNEENAKWSRGEFPDYASEESRGMTYSEWAVNQPKTSDYMPAWPDEQRTHLMMYETTSEGTPISPAFETPEELAQWLVDNKASAFGSSTGTYEGWLRVARGGWAPSMVATAAGVTSGVDAL